jgi:hypothetical protein
MSFGVLVLLVAIGGYYVWKLVRDRTAAFKAGADALGFTFVGKQSPFGNTDVGGLTLVADTNLHRYRNVLVHKSGSPIVIPEYTYAIRPQYMRRGMSGASDGETQNHSLILFRIPHGSLPVFQVTSRGIVGNLGVPVDSVGLSGQFTKSGMDVGSEAFSERYVISAADETQVRFLFTPELVRAFVEQPPHTWLHVQTSLDWLLFYDPRFMILKPENVLPALQRVKPIAAMMHQGDANAL